MLAARKLEFDIMCVIPFGIILYMKLTFGEFIGILYGNITGAAVYEPWFFAVLWGDPVGR